MGDQLNTRKGRGQKGTELISCKQVGFSYPTNASARLSKPVPLPQNLDMVFKGQKMPSYLKTLSFKNQNNKMVRSHFFEAVYYTLHPKKL